MRANQRLLFLASGRGSCFDAVARAITDGKLTGAQIVGLICNQTEAPVLELARQRGVTATVLAHKQYRGANGKWDRKGYEHDLRKAIESYQPDWICLAGYLLLLNTATVKRWAGKILNIHPSLLPAFPGLHAQKQALEQGVLWTGCTVHFVTENLDEGPILDQSVLAIQPDDTADSLSARLLPIEHETYTRALQKLCNRPFRVQGNRVLWD